MNLYMSNLAFVSSLDSIDKGDIAIAGGKGANLGEMIKMGLPVPKGFVVTVASYRFFLKENSLDKKIYNILTNIDIDKPQELQETSKVVQKMIKNSPIPQILVKEIAENYKTLSGIFTNASVAVRSSATSEDMPKTSFAGQQSSFMDVNGVNSVVNSVKDCWASLFEARSIYYRVQNKIPHEKVGICVVVQKMINSEASGVMFTIDPVNETVDRIIIESVWGLGDLIVQGSVLPDHYVVQKETFDILSKEISEQAVMLVKAKQGTKEVRVKNINSSKQKITDAEIVDIAKIGDKIQKHYYYPQDIEWAKEKGKIYIIQTRPITTLGKKSKGTLANGLTSLSPILQGIAASPGIGVGRVKILKSAKEIAKIDKGDVLVAPMTSPDFVSAMKKANAIVTDEGGQTSHAAIVSRELGIPCVVGTKLATKKLVNGDLITVDGKKGLVYFGKVESEKDSLPAFSNYKASSAKTATKLYVNLAEVERAKEISSLNTEGVGLLRAEFMIANIGIHPKEAIIRKKRENYINKLSASLEVFCKNFEPRPVVYRSTDFRTNEYRELEGGEKWEPKEANPMLGYRGAFRYISDPEVFTMELLAVKKVRQKYKNLYLMIPFVRSPQELFKVKRIVASEGLFESHTFKLWMMVELPVNVISLEDFIKVGIDGVSIGANDLTMLITGTDRDNSSVAPAFDSLSPALLWSIKRVIKSCQRHGITSSICGQAPSVYDELVEYLVKTGITSISVNPDAIDRVRGVIANTENGKNI